jgi:AraC family transcriptional regulator, activator of mtrCDE
MENSTQMALRPLGLDGLLKTLDVEFVRLTECVVSSGWSLTLQANEQPGLHYSLLGRAQLIVNEDPPIELVPHTLVIVPPGAALILRASTEGIGAKSGCVDSRSFSFPAGTLRRLVAGPGRPDVIMICGYFRATYASSIDLFGALSAPIVENFTAADQLDEKLKSALSELIAQEIGCSAMSTALLKQVLITLLRRASSSGHLWAERFSVLKDPKVARAFADMVARPGWAHSLSSLADKSGLSRSSFMQRFTDIFGDSPMAVLRRLRLRHARMLLAGGTLSIEQVANLVGYRNRSSFSRAYKRLYGHEPTIERP